ncbi:MAG TPA: hypothetical protein VES02_16730 [Dermatophilaceae bacterium]|nr:hypothetical protein [Dermatophilaceae bacterium]
MIVDCMTCPVRGQRCDGCVVTALHAPGSAGHLSAAGPVLSTEVPLDAAESRVVSMFLGAGLVSAGAAARFRARRESLPSWGAVRSVG